MAESRTAVMAALLGNAALAVLKGAAAVSTGSAAMLAETLHSVADTGNQGLLFLGMRLAKRPPNQRHPFGHGQNIYFWGFVVSVMLFALGGAFAQVACDEKAKALSVGAGRRRSQNTMPARPISSSAGGPNQRM